MYTGIFHTHKLAVVLFLLIYTIKLVLLFINKDKLEVISKLIKIPEMIISFLFLITGIYLIINTADVSNLLIFKILLVLSSIPLAILGFKKKNKWLAVLSVLFIVAAYGLSEINRGLKAKRIPIQASIVTDTSREKYDVLAHGKALFLSQCALCHGESGKLALSGAKDLTISQMDNDKMNEIIQNGKNTMPAYKEIFSPEEVVAIITYIHTLRTSNP